MNTSYLRQVWFPLLCLLLGITFIASLGIGPVHLTWREVLAALWSPRSDHSTAAVIVLQLRLPRALTAMLVGAGLALSGAVLQALLRNPLAEPFTLGVSGGAGFLVTTLAAFAPALLARPYAAPLAGFAGAALATVIVFGLAHRHAFSSTALVLCGIILSSFFGSLVLLNFAFGRPEAIQNAMTWLMGTLAGADMRTVWAAFAGMTVPAIYMFASCQTLDVLGIGEARALSLGVAVPRVRRLLFTAAALVTGICVASSGIIAFVGFLVPHFSRYLAGARHRALLPMTAVAGALFLLLADTLARSLFGPLELPVGAITGIVGTFFFLLYYWRRPPGEIA